MAIAATFLFKLAVLATKKSMEILQMRKIYSMSCMKRNWKRKHRS